MAAFLNWQERTESNGKYLISEDGKYKITNEGPKGGNRYCLWAEMEWMGPNGRNTAFARLVRMGTIEECKQ